MSPDPSTQIAPDPAPSGGEYGSHGAGGQAPQHTTSTPISPRVTPTYPPVSSSAPAAAAPTSTVHQAVSKPRHHHVAAKHRRAHHATHEPKVRVQAARRVPAIFASSLQLALHVPAPVPADAAAHSGDVLLLAAIALLLFVFSGLMVVRTTAQGLRRERLA